jgi:hypothetical protein
MDDPAGLAPGRGTKHTYKWLSLINVDDSGEMRSARELAHIARSGYSVIHARY